MKMPDKLYDVLKWVALILCPTLSAGYYEIGIIWNWPYVVEIPKTITEIGLVIGALIGISQLAINKERSEQNEAEGYSEDSKELKG